MVTNTFARVCLALTLSAVATPLLAAEKPAQKQIASDLERLDSLKRIFTETQARDDQFGKAFWTASKRLGEERGVEIIHALMVHSAKWKGEEGLIFVPLVALLPRKAALKVLHQYQHSKRESERIFANECITEFEMEDTEAAVKEYSGKK